MLPAFIATPIAIKATIIAAAAASCACIVLRQRPSTLIRVTEDAAVKAADFAVRAPLNVVRGAKRLAHETKIEYRARQMDELHRMVVESAIELRDMSPEKRAQLASDEARVFARSEELRAKREGSSVEPDAIKPRRASRSRRSATA